MAEAGVQERRRHHPEQPVRVTRLDPVLIEAVVERDVDDLERPHRRQQSEHDAGALEA